MITDFNDFNDLLGDYACNFSYEEMDILIALSEILEYGIKYNEDSVKCVASIIDEKEKQKIKENTPQIQSFDELRYIFDNISPDCKFNINKYNQFTFAVAKKVQDRGMDSDVTAREQGVISIMDDGKVINVITFFRYLNSDNYWLMPSDLLDIDLKYTIDSKERVETVYASELKRIAGQTSYSLNTDDIVNDSIICPRCGSNLSMDMCVQNDIEGFEENSYYCPTCDEYISESEILGVSNDIEE